MYTVEVSTSSHFDFSAFPHRRKWPGSVPFGEADETHVTGSEVPLPVPLPFWPHCAVRSRLDMTPAGTLHTDALAAQPPRRNNPVRDETP
jgi:hypothetical protein